MLGDHCLKSWSTTQDVVALSSGEAEFYGIVRASAQGLGLKSMMGYFGITVGVRVHTDASAAKGIAVRKGLGKVRHIEVSQLWIQDAVARGEIVLIKIRTSENIADMFTKHVDRALLDQHCKSMQLPSMPGRHSIAPTT
jgi:hypothetical protein